MNGLRETELVMGGAPGKYLEDEAFGTLERADWLNNSWVPTHTGPVPPAEFQEVYYRWRSIVKDEITTQLSPR